MSQVPRCLTPFFTSDVHAVSMNLFRGNISTILPHSWSMYASAKGVHLGKNIMAKMTALKPHGIGTG